MKREESKENSKKKDSRYTFPIKTGRAASDLLANGKMSPQEFGALHMLQYHSTWGYAGKCNFKSIEEWSTLFQVKRRKTYYILNRLVDLGLLYRYPNNRRNLRLIVFQESLTPEEIVMYVERFNENPKLGQMAKIGETVEESDLTSENFKSQTIGYSTEIDTDDTSENDDEQETSFPFH